MCLDALFDDYWNLPTQSQESRDTYRAMSSGWLVVQS